MFKIASIVTLSDKNKYAIISKAVVKDEGYYFIADVNNQSNIKVCVEQKKNKSVYLKEIEDTKIIKSLIPYFEETAKAYLNGETD